MTNNMVYERVHSNMLALGLKTSEAMLDNWLSTAQGMSAMDILDHLLEQEASSKRSKAVASRKRLSGIPVEKRVRDFDFEYQKSIDKKAVDELCTLRFVHNAENLIILGPPGVGKTHIAVGLGVEAAEAGFSVRFVNSAELIARLKKAEGRGLLDRKLRALAKCRLLIIDEIGYLPFDSEAANVFFKLVSMRYEKASTIFTSNKSYGEWGEIFGDPVIATAILDRMLHHSITLNIKGESYRLKQRRESGTLFPRAEGKNDMAGGQQV